MGAGVTSVGCVVVDLAKIIDAYPEPDHLALIDDVSLSTGGPALNMVVNLARLGASFPKRIVGAVGADQHADYLRAECRRLGIDDTGLMVIDGAATSFTDVFLERVGGRRTMFYHPGAGDRLEAAAVAVDPGDRILHVGAPGILAGMDAATGDGGTGWTDLLRRGREAGLHTNMELVDLAPEAHRRLVLPCLPLLNSIVINELEAGHLTGIDCPSPNADGETDWAALEAMAVRLVELGVSTVAVIHFPAGCVAAAPDGRTWRQGSVLLPPDQVRSAVGAGDAFASGVLYGIHERWEIDDSLRLAVATAAACVRDTHTSAGIGPAADCLAEADRLGHRPVD